jgi:hypothetical protein
MLLLQSIAHMFAARATAQVGATVCAGNTAGSTSAMGYRGKQSCGSCDMSRSNTIWSRSDRFSSVSNFIRRSIRVFVGQIRQTNQGNKQTARKSHEHQSFGLLEQLPSVLFRSRRGPAY